MDIPQLAYLCTCRWTLRWAYCKYGLQEVFTRVLVSTHIASLPDMYVGVEV